MFSVARIVRNILRGEEEEIAVFKVTYLNPEKIEFVINGTKLSINLLQNFYLSIRKQAENLVEELMFKIKLSKEWMNFAIKEEINNKITGFSGFKDSSKIILDSIYTSGGGFLLLFIYLFILIFFFKLLFLFFFLKKKKP